MTGTPDDSVATHCRCLRTKGMYVPRFAAIPPLEDASATAVFWCLKTMKMTGPDERFVTPDACLPGRACYETDAPPEGE